MDSDPKFYTYGRHTVVGPQPKSKALIKLAEIGTRVPLITKDCKQYNVWGLMSFCKAYVNMPVEERRYFEIIPPNVPCKLYLDIDYKGEYEFPLYEEFETKMIQQIKTMLAEQFDYNVPQLDPIILSGTTPQKFSRHYIFPVVFECQRLVGDFVKDLVHHLRSEEMSSWVDLGVYTNYRNFRIFGSTKEGKNNWLTLVSHQDRNWGFLQTLLRSFVSIIREDDEPLKLCRDLQHVQRVYKIVKLSEDADDSLRQRYYSAGITGSIEIPDKYKEFVEAVEEKVIKKQWPNFQYYKSFQQFNGTDYVDYIFVPGLPCPNNGNKAHKSNRTYCKVDLNLKIIFFRCADPCCRGFVFSDQSLKHICPCTKVTQVHRARKKRRVGGNF